MTAGGLSAQEVAALEGFAEDPPPTFKMRAVGMVIGALFYHHDAERGAMVKILEEQVGRTLFGDRLRTQEARRRGAAMCDVAIASGYVERRRAGEIDPTVNYLLTDAGRDLVTRASAKIEEEKTRLAEIETSLMPEHEKQPTIGGSK